MALYLNFKQTALSSCLSKVPQSFKLFPDTATYIRGWEADLLKAEEITNGERRSSNCLKKMTVYLALAKT